MRCLHHICPNSCRNCELVNGVLGFVVDVVKEAILEAFTHGFF